MYETTAEELHSEILRNIEDTYQKTIGYPTYDITKAFAMTLYKLYVALSGTADKLDVDHLQGAELEKFIKQRKGTTRKAATYAKCMLTVIGNGIVKKGDLFESIGGVQFAAAQTVEIAENAIVPVIAVLPGIAGNVAAGAITMIPKTLPGITGCNNEQPAMDGYAAETDESLRSRYYEELRRPATSGNIYHYIQWAKSVPGVGDARAFPLWNGDNTVQVVIINDEGKPADNSLVEAAQNYIDPGSRGMGEGEAPIGAYCTVTSASSVGIAVSVALKRMPGYQMEAVKQNITTAIEDYLKSIAFVQDYMSYGKIANAINDSEGVEDYSNLKVNEGTANISVGEKEVAVLIGVTVIEQAG